MPSSTPLYPLAAIREIELAALAEVPAGTLMQRAAQEAASLALNLIDVPLSAAKVLLLVGPGNNGGDALVTACLLAEAGARPTVMLCTATDNQPEDARNALQRAKSSAIDFITPTPDAIYGDWNLVIDGLFGIGLARPISGLLRDIVERVNAMDCRVLALDIPSGLDADTGSIIGDHGIAIKATHTITFIGDKPGLHTCEGRDYAGHIHVADLDIDKKHFKPVSGRLNTIALFSDFLKHRPHNSHKGSYGDVIVAGGAHGMSGAPILASRAAAHLGAGRVFAAFLEEAPAYDSVQPELMCRLASTIDLASGTLVVGPGLGTSAAALDLLAKALHTSTPLVLDADALNLVASDLGLQQILAQREVPALLTPHPLEAARLLQTTAREIQVNRPAAARRLAHQLHAVVILKGSGSVIARHDGEMVINPTGNPALATAGTGDVLAGMCGALLAQCFPAWEAALAATWIHGHAADLLVEHGIGPIGLTAGELIPCARTILNQLTTDYARHAPR